MPRTTKIEIVRIEDRWEAFARLTYEDNTQEDFSVIRGSISWLREGNPGLILLGGIPRGSETDTIKVIEENSFGTLFEARKILVSHAAHYNKIPLCFYYRSTPESEGFVSFLKGGGVDRLPFLHLARYTESVEYGIQLVNSSLEEGKLKVPANGILATQLLSYRDNTPDEKDLFGIMSLVCLISGIETRFEEPFPGLFDIGF